MYVFVADHGLLMESAICADATHKWERTGRGIVCERKDKVSKKWR